MEIDDNPNSALKLIFCLSLILVIMDIVEIYFSYMSMLKAIKLFDRQIFEQCFKYHFLTQIFFTFFATFAGLSACLMSLGLLISYNFFSSKCLDTFFNWNYIIFGPYLFSSSLLGYIYFSEIAFICDVDNKKHMDFNYSTLFALILCFIISFTITFSYSIIWAYYKFTQSIRYSNDGSRFLGRIFWNHVLSRSLDRNHHYDNTINN
jgi:hypothetical protein